MRSQLELFDALYAVPDRAAADDATGDPFLRYVRERRLTIALADLRRMLGSDVRSCSVLVVCGGVGREASFFAERGFSDVTNSDFSPAALAACGRRDPRLKTMTLDAESLDLPDGAYDIVVVQDGLHHLPRPVQGLNEMVRVARQAVVVIEPHVSLVGTLLGTMWERQGDAVNFVFRWDGRLFRQVVLSQLLERPVTFRCRRLWDHNVWMTRLFGRIPGARLRILLVRLFYAALRLVPRSGNMFIGVLVTRDPR